MEKEISEFKEKDELAKMNKKTLVLAAQTTQNLQEWKKTEKNIKEAEKSEEKIASLKIIDFGAKTAQVKYIISRRINISIHDAFSLDSNDIIEIHQNDVISLKNELESLGATVQIVDKKSNEAKGALSTVVSGVHKHTADILRQAMENAIKVLNETKKD